MLPRRVATLLGLAISFGPGVVSAQEDTTPPSLVQLIINTPVVDTTVNSATFTITIRVRDDLSGPQSVNALIQGPTGINDPVFCDVLSTLSSLETIRDCSEALPVFSPLGTYTIARLELVDRVGNTRLVFTEELLSLGFPTTFQNADLSGQPDADNDGVPDANDNCPDDANSDQQDRDLDLIGDVCDPDPDDPLEELSDEDGDDVADVFDNCPQEPNADQTDLDTDRVGDACDNCVPLANRSQIDGDQNGIGDVCDALAEFVGPGEVSSEDFEALVAEVAGLQAAIGDAETRIAALEAAGSPEDLQALKDQVAELEERLAAIENLPGIRQRLR